MAKVILNIYARQKAKLYQRANGFISEHCTHTTWSVCANYVPLTQLLYALTLTKGLCQNSIEAAIKLNGT